LVQPTLEAAARGVLGAPPPGQTDWLRHELDETAHSPNLYFRYPTQLSAGFAYMPREVKLELGTLTDQQPVARHQIRPLLADAFPQLFDEWSCEVTALALERTFWEKATILHAEFHRPAAQATPDRYARHYADVARLLARADAATHLADAALCAHVVGWKRRVFPRAWARYDLAHAGTFRLLPTQERRAALAQDYAAMQQMFITEPPPFDQVLDQLAEAETQLNAGKKD
jgi:hypothetical protein